jgi:hypothetical protein
VADTGSEKSAAVASPVTNAGESATPNNLEAAPTPARNPSQSDAGSFTRLFGASFRELVPLFVVILNLFLWAALSLAISSLVNPGGGAVGSSQMTQTAADGTMALDDWDKVFSILSNLATIVALVLGGIWTYYTFIKGRTLTPHLEPKVYGRVLKKEEEKYLLATIQIKNIGATRVDIERSGTVLVVYLYRANIKNPAREDDLWERFYKAPPILTNHYWIEPNETIEEPALIPLPAIDSAIYKIRLRVNSTKTTWTADTIIEGVAAVPKT